MPFNAIHEYDANTASNNIDIGGANIAEGCAPSGINNALRELAKQIRRAVANQGSDIASSATTDIGAATGQYVRVTGTVTITSLGTVNAGTTRWVEFTGALTLTHNATSLKLPGSANIATSAGDVGLFVSLGAGNWKCLHFSKADGAPVAGAFTGVLTSTDPGTGQGPTYEAYRNSASPAALDALGALELTGNNSAAAKKTYARIIAEITDATAGSEDARLYLRTTIAGTLTTALLLEQGAQIGAPTGGDKGVGTPNANGLYVGGHGTMAQSLTTSYATYTSTATAIPYDDTIPQITEGIEIMTQAITPVNASSTILIRVDLVYGVNAPGTSVNAALFVDATANAVKAASSSAAGGVNTATLSFEYSVSATNTSVRTYRLRVGPGSGTMYINGDSSARRFGGVSACTMTVQEILPQ